MGINRAGYTLPSSPWFPMFIDVLRKIMDSPDWEPQRVEGRLRTSTVSNTVDELAIMFAGM